VSSNTSKFTLRIDQQILEKFRYIADNNFRTVNKELEMIIKAHIIAYETKNGQIKVDLNTK
jgi:hypothetical protein